MPQPRPKSALAACRPRSGAIDSHATQLCLRALRADLGLDCPQGPPEFYSAENMKSSAALYSVLCLLTTLVAWGEGAPAKGFVQDQFVVGMWVSPQTQENLDARYQEIAEANFTLVVGESGTDVQKHLERCRRLGLKTLIGANGPVDKLPDGPACWGYLLMDEPGAGAFAGLAKQAEENSRQTSRPIWLCEPVSKLRFLQSIGHSDL